MWGCKQSITTTLQDPRLAFMIGGKNLDYVQILAERPSKGKSIHKSET